MSQSASEGVGRVWGSAEVGVIVATRGGGGGGEEKEGEVVFVVGVVGVVVGGDGDVIV